MSAKFRFPLRRTCAACLLLVAATVSAWAQPEGAGAASRRVVAIGDVHGAFPEFVTILERTGLIDPKLQWTGGSAVVVQTGGLPDPGAGDRVPADLSLQA